MSSTFLSTFKGSLYTVDSQNFESRALALFRYQSAYNPIYRQYLFHLKKDISQVTALAQIPFLPVEFFKTHQVTIADEPVQAIFESSQTTGQKASKHFVADVDFYKNTSQYIFEQVYGPLASCHILALLPSYLERKNASLVYMAAHFIEQSHSPESGFYLHNKAELIKKLLRLKQHTGKVILLGVTFALLDLAEEYGGTDLSHVTVIETGGMKGRREELLREELHGILKQKFNLPAVHAEYGMTELLSQAYSVGEGIFWTPPWMKMLVRDINDPFSIQDQPRSGGMNIIDLANAHSCAFIETKDIGIKIDETHFKVLGRFDNADIRGCNLMVG